MADRFPPVKINFASVDVVGVPGLCLVAIVVAIAIEFPEAGRLLLSGVVGGALLSAVIFRVRSWRPMDAVMTRISTRPSFRRDSQETSSTTPR
jgi:hypothetical protein